MRPLERRRSEAGFVLPSVVIVIAIMTLALWSAASVLDSLNDDLRGLRARAELERSAAGVEARIAYLIATEPIGPRGLRLHGRRVSQQAEFGFEEQAPELTVGEIEAPEGTLWFDNRPYLLQTAGEGSRLAIRIQDEAGLFNVNTSDSQAIGRFVASFGIDEVVGRHLADALADFVDSDDLRRLNGAEVDDYRRAGRPLPFNEPLTDSRQIFLAQGWDTLAPILQVSALENTTAGMVTVPFNINTATKNTLRAWFNLDADAAQQVLDVREHQVLFGTSQITQITGQPVVEEDLRLYTFPARRFRVIVETAGPGPHFAYQTWLSIGVYTADRPFFWAPVTVTTNRVSEGGAIRDESDRFPDVSGVLDNRAGRNFP